MVPRHSDALVEWNRRSSAAHLSWMTPTKTSRRTTLLSWTPADSYVPLRSRCLHPGQQQGRRWPSSSSSWVRRMRRSRVFACLAASTQQMNSLRAKGVMSFQASRAVGLVISASRSLLEACAPPHRALAGCSPGHGSGSWRARPARSRGHCDFADSASTIFGVRENFVSEPTVRPHVPRGPLARHVVPHEPREQEGVLPCHAQI